MTRPEILKVEKQISDAPRTWGGALFLLLDSGSFTHAYPNNFMKDIGIEPLAGSLPALAANGRAMQCYGKKTVMFELWDGQHVQIEVVVMDVRRPLLSIGKLAA
eukprot:15638739-Heterocapsa_arctica.AAC.1